jgi:hypothetical protein
MNCSISATFGNYADRNAVFHDKFARAGRQAHNTAAFVQPRAQPAQGHIRTPALPVQPGRPGPGRRHDPAHKFKRPAFDEFSTLCPDPRQRAFGFVRHHGGVQRCVVCTGLRFDCRDDVVRRCAHILERDMQQPARKP